MKNVSITPSGLAPGQSYKIEVVNAASPSTIVFSKNNIIAGSTIVFPVSVPGTYIVKLYNHKDLLNICETNSFNEKSINVYFPIVEYNISETDCSTETYTVSLSVTNPETSGEEYKFGWGNVETCTGVTWVDGNIITLQSDGNDKYIFVQYDGCCELLVKTNKSPCINCNITIETLVSSCGEVAPPPIPDEHTCKSYKLTGGSVPSFVFYLDCNTFLVESVSLMVGEELIICSAGTPITSFVGTGTTVEEIGNCPN